MRVTIWIAVRVFLALAVAASHAQVKSVATNQSNLWLNLVSASSNQASLALNNTQGGQFYEILGAENLKSTVWDTKGLVLANSTSTPVSVPTSSRTNYMFYRGISRRPTNGAVWLTLQSGYTNLAASVNRVSRSFGAFPFSTIVEIPGPVLSLNVGYDGSDEGTWDIPWTPQNVVAVTGLTNSLTTFCASYSPLASLDLHGLKGIQDIECYWCTNLSWVNVTNCPALTRVCFEGCNIGGVLNFSGDTNLADIRGAANDYTNIVFGGAGPKVWHLCVRTNPQLSENLVLTNFKALSVWYMWTANQGGVVTRATMPSTVLTDVQIYDNHFRYADFTGETKLQTLLIGYNELTNLVIKGCASLTNLSAPGNWLTSAAMDSILTTLYNNKKTYGSVDLSGNGTSPSATGRTAATNLQTKLHWTVNIRP